MGGVGVQREIETETEKGRQQFMPPVVSQHRFIPVTGGGMKGVGGQGEGG